MRTFIALGPATFVSHANSSIITLIKDTDALNILNFFKLYDFLPRNFLETKFGAVFCKFFGSFCDNIVQEITGYDASYDNANIFDNIAGHDPSGTSI